MGYKIPMDRLIEREQATAQFAEAIKCLSSGQGGVILVSGEAGVGKTSLLTQLRKDFSSSYQFLWSGCDPLFTPRPFGPVYDLRSSFSKSAINLLEKGAAPSTIFSAIYDELEQISQATVLIVEDVHWADHATLDLLKFLSRRMSFLPCVLVMSFRDDEVDHQHPLHSVLEVLPSAHTTRIKVQPLSQQGVNTLLANPDRDSSSLFKITGGNPFFVTELIASDTDSIPASIQDAINTRLAPLVKKERLFLETISVIPNAVSIELINALFGSEGETYAMACVARNLLSIDHHQTFRFRHELARLGTLTSIPINTQQPIHQRILRALEQTDSDLGSLVHHASAALDGERVLRYASEAAEKASAQGAHREAASYFATALKFVDGANTEQAAQLYESWAYEAGIAMRIDDEVIEARRHAITLWRALDRSDKVGENLRSLSRLHWYRGEAAEANHFANSAINVLENSPPSSERAMAYSLRSQLDMLNDRMSEAINWGEKALELEQQFPNIEVRIHALNNLGSAEVLRGLVSGEEKLQQSMQLAIDHDFHEHAARAYTNLSDYAVRYKKLNFAEKIIGDGIAFDTQHDLDSWTYYLVGIQAQLRMEQGRLTDAETISLGVLGLDKLTMLMQLPALIVLARTQMRLNNSEYEVRLRQSLNNAFEIDEYQYIIPARFGAVEAAWLNDKQDAAYQHLKLISELDDTALDHWRAGELNVWIKRFGFELKKNSSFILPKPYELELAGQHLEAAEEWMSLGMPFNAAFSLSQVNADQAAKALPKAYKIFDSIEAKAMLPLIRNKAKALGLLSKLPRPRRGPYKMSRQHPIGLTKREQEVLKLLIEGASNAEISEQLSRSQRTIENHVSSILGKMNVSNRLEVMLRVQNEPWLAA